MEFQIVITLVGWFLLFQKFDLVYTVCQPPDFPESGSYKPEYKTYLPGDKVVFSCKDRFTQFGKDERMCQTNGKWTASTPFCDSPTKLKNPRSSYNTHIANVLDNSPNTCFSTVNMTEHCIRVYLDVPAPVDAVRIYLQRGKVNFKINVFPRRRGATTSTECIRYERYIEDNQWVTLECKDNDILTDYLEIRDISDKSNALAVCEIEAYVKDDAWCRYPPDIFIPNGRFEVSHNKATLRCADGYTAVDNSRLVCERNSWAGPNLQCEEVLCAAIVGNSTTPHGEWLPLDHKARKLSVGIRRQLKCEPGFHVIGKPDIVACTKFGVWSETGATCVANPSEKKSSFKTIAIASGAVAAAVIFFLLGLTMYLLYKKRAREVVVIYKPGDEGYTSPPSICSSVGTEAEYSTVYYDAIYKNNRPPMTPTRPPHLRPIVEGEYMKPVDELRPADIAFGTLKSSALYDAMD